LYHYTMYAEAAKQKERLDVMGGSDLGAATKAAIASVFSAASKAQEAAAAEVAGSEGGPRSTAALVGAASRAAQLAAIKRAKTSSQHSAELVITEAEKKGGAAEATVIEADAVAESALKEAHAAADEAYAEVGLCKLYPVDLTHSLKAPGDPTLEPMK
jgi:hypothetical protein